MTTTLIKNGRIVTAVDDYNADILIDGGTIAMIGKSIDVAADKVIDAKGRLVIPGGIDPHTHMELPFGGTSASDTFETGTIAAAHGGTTTIIDFAVQYKGQSLKQAVDAWHAKADGRTSIDYGFHLICTDLPDERLPEMKSMIDEGVSSFKLFMAYPGVFLVDDATIFKAMGMAGENGGLICMHAENGVVIDAIVKKALADGKTAPKYHALTRPTKAEAEGVHRAIALAEMADAPVYIVHLSCDDSLQEVTRARDMGINAYAETCPQYLFLDYSVYEQPGFEGAKFVMTPPIREKWNQEKLWRGLKFNDLQVVATDHCPFCMKEQKELGKNDFSKIPNGMPGVETRLHLLWEGVTKGKISMNRFVEITSTAPAKIFGMYGKKGTLAVGADADVVVWDPKRKKRLDKANLHMRVDYSPFEGHEVPGSPSHVLSRGELIVENDQWVGKKKQGRGQFVRRGTFGL